MKVDLWAPGTALSKNSSGRHLLNAMCDLTQFVVSNITTEKYAEHIAKVFMDNVVLLFSMVAILVIDSTSSFKSIFKDMCSALGIIYWTLSCRNHKGMSVEKYHHFLNKTQTISYQDRGMHDVFLQNKKSSQYAPNSTPIDGTDILISVAAVGREFRVLLDVELLKTPTTLKQGNSGLYEYLRHVSNKSHFATSIFQIIIKERRTAHRERWNQN